MSEKKKDMTVAELNTFLIQYASLSVSNTVWMNENLNNWLRHID